jgi:LPXTG-motif cell wall-anchored protein
MNLLVNRKMNIFLVLVILLAIFSGGFQTKALAAVSNDDLQHSIDLTSDYVKSSGKYSIGDWDIVTLKKAGKTIPDNYLENVTSKINQGNLPITDYERYVLSILAAGGDPTNVAGFNLIETIYSGDVTSNGEFLNGVYFALIALDSSGFETPNPDKWTREKLISEILKNQKDDGSWTYNNKINPWLDLDTPAQVLTALAPYGDQEIVKISTEKGLDFIKNNSNFIDNSSTAASIIIALSALGKNANQEININGVGLVDYVLSFQHADGGFSYMGEEENDAYSTQLAFQGLVSYQLFLNEKGSYYNLAVPGMDSEQPKVEEPVIVQPEQPQTETPKSETPQADLQSQVQKTTGTVTQIADSKESLVKQVQKGKPLPNTATNVFNLAAFGLLLLVMGIGFVLINRKKSA